MWQKYKLGNLTYATALVLATSWYGREVNRGEGGDLKCSKTKYRNDFGVKWAIA